MDNLKSSSKVKMIYVLKHLCPEALKFGRRLILPEVLSKITDPWPHS